MHILHACSESRTSRSKHESEYEYVVLISTLKAFCIRAVVSSTLLKTLFEIRAGICYSTDANLVSASYAQFSVFHPRGDPVFSLHFCVHEQQPHTLSPQTLTAVLENLSLHQRNKKGGGKNLSRLH